MKEEKIRERLEEITTELVRIKNKKYQTDIVEKNKEYRQLCIRQWTLEREKESLLSLIKDIYARRN